jgi:hypothetical protein
MCAYLFKLSGLLRLHKYSKLKFAEMNKLLHIHKIVATILVKSFNLKILSPY